MSPNRVTKPIDIYVRVSQVGGREGDSFISPELQEERCRLQLAADGHEVGEIFTDLDRSGTKMKRPKFDIAMARALTGESGGLIVWKLSRFGRSTRGVLAAVKQLEDAGAAFISCDPKVDTSSPAGRFMLTVFAALDEMEVDNLRDGLGASAKNAHGRGVLCGPTPTGYVRGDGKRLAVGPHAPAVVAAFKARASGASWKVTAAVLEDAGVPAGRGGAWSKASAKAVIRNRIYLGELHREGMAVVKMHPALVELPLFLRANKVRGDRPVSQGGDGPLLGGIVKCASCSGAMTRDYTRKDERVFVLYRCKGKAGCTARATIQASIIEPYVLAAVRERLEHARVTAEEVEPSADLDALREVMLDAMAEAEEVEARRGELSAFEYGKASGEAEERVRSAAQAVADAEEGVTTRFDVPPGVTAVMAFDVLFETLPVPEQRTFISNVLGDERVYVGRGRGTERVAIGVERPEAVAA